MENKNNVTVSNKMETAKKKYTLSGTAIAEMTCSVILLIALFLPWAKIELCGESREFILIEAGEMAFLYAGVFLFNILLKCFKRSHWMSMVTAAVAILMHTEIGANQLNSKYNYSITSCTPAIGEQIVFMVGMILLAIVLVSWTSSIGASIVRAYRNKKYLRIYFSSLGLYFLYFIAIVLFGSALAGSMDELFETKDHLTLIVFGGFLLLGPAVFFCWGIIGGIIWIIRKIRGTTNLPASQTKHKIETQEGAIPSIQPKEHKDNSIIQQEESTLPKESIHGNYQESETTSKDNRPLLYSVGGIIAVAIIGIICFIAFGKEKKSENILGLQKPKWEKFVHMKGKETAFFQSPNLSSPQLMQACNADGCGIDYQYLWSGNKPSEGYTDFENYKYTDETSVFPVIEEQDGWYKVYLSTKDKIHEAYVEKSQCEVVTPEPITQEALSKISSDFYLLEQGKYKNLCFALGSNDIDETKLCMGELMDEKCIAFSSYYEMYILENDTTQSLNFTRDEYTSDDGTTSYTFSIFFNPNRTISAGDYEHFNTKSLTEEEISNMVEKSTSVKHDNDRLKYAYYFPSVSGNSLFYFYKYKDLDDEENMEEVTTAKHISNYRVEDIENLIATVDGEDREVDLDIGRTALYGVKDLDGDGNMEAIVSHYMSGINGIAVDCPFIVYYDSESDTFKKTEEMKITIDTEPTIEEDGGKPIIIQRDGLRTVRYMFANKKLIILDDKTKKYGHIGTKIDLADLFGDEEGEKTKSVVFPNGEEATLHFVYENVGMYHGLKMTLKDIELSNGEKIYVGEAAKTFYILKETTNDMPEIIGDTHLYRWNGENYVEE